MNKKDEEYGIREEGSTMSLDKIFGIYTVPVSWGDHPHRHRRAAFGLPNSGSAGSSWACRC